MQVRTGAHVGRTHAGRSGADLRSIRSATSSMYGARISCHLDCYDLATILLGLGLYLLAFFAVFLGNTGWRRSGQMAGRACTRVPSMAH